MKAALIALALLAAIPAAQAQVIIQAPRIPGVTVPAGDPYWRHDNQDWRRREEYREEARRAEWRREHCVRDYHGQEFCRR